MSKYDKMDDFIRGLLEADEEDELTSKIVAKPGKNPLNGYSIALLMDTSYSMKGQRINDAKKALIRFVEGIDLNQNEITLVTFGDGVHLMDGFKQDAKQLKEHINNMMPGGANPLFTALKKSYEKLLSSKNYPVIILATDGIPGDATKDFIVEYADKLKKEKKIWMIMVGITKIVDELFLERLATSPDYYYFAETSEELVGTYEEILEEFSS